MTESAASTRHISMKGGGYYSKATIGAKDVIDGGIPMIMEALSTMDIPDIEHPFTMADSGCADGGTSVTMVGSVLREVRRRAPNRATTGFDCWRTAAESAGRNSCKSSSSQPLRRATK